EFPPANVNLPPAQLVVVATPAFVVLAVLLLALVDMVERGIGVVLRQRKLNEVREPREAVRPLGPRRTLHEGSGKSARQLPRVQPRRGRVGLPRLPIAQLLDVEARQLRGAERANAPRRAGSGARRRLHLR